MKKSLNILLVGLMIASSIPVFAGNPSIDTILNDLETTKETLKNGVQQAQNNDAELDELQAMAANLNQPTGFLDCSAPKRINGKNLIIGGSVIVAAVLLVIAAGIICKVVINKKKNKQANKNA